MLEPQTDTLTSARSPVSRVRRFLFPALLLIAYAGQCIWFIQTQSFTLDEPGHIAAGLAMWKYGRFVIQNDNPPLARKIGTAPLHFFTNVDVDNLQRDSHSMPPGLHPVHAWYVRIPFVLVGVVLGIALWLATARLFSESAAAFALALFAFSPGLIAHFSVATTDGTGTLTLFLVTIAFVAWANTPSWKNACVLGIAVGCMLLAKFYAAPATAVLLVLMSFEALRRRSVKPIQQALAVGALAALIVCVGYNFHIARFQFSNGTMDAHFQHREQDWVAAVPFTGSFTVYVPGGDYIDGLARVYRTNNAWHNAYLFGDKAFNGFRGYHFFAILMKWPPVVLLLSAVGFFLISRNKVPLSRGARLAAVLPIAFLVLALTAQLQIGDRHVLPVYPFLLILAAAAWHYFRDSRKALTVLALLAVANAIDVMRYSPDYLSYFTPFVRPTQTWRYLGDSNIDWGQGMIALRKYQDQHPDEKLYVRTFGGVDPRFYGIRSERFAENERPHGTVVVTAVDMAGYDLNDPQAMQWLWQHPLRAYLNHTLFVFKVD
jgi:4-amino-4-deoxy-L-arabinose transferase-like glycosyltransferase